MGKFINFLFSRQKHPTLLILNSNTNFWKVKSIQRPTAKVIKYHNGLE